MRRLLLAALLMLALPAMAHAQTAVDWETTAGGALANPWVQKKNCPNVTPNGSHVATCAFTSNVTSGDKEVAIVFVNSATIAINSASGSNCGSMSAKGSPTLAAPSTAGFVCTAATSAAETISVTLASGTPSTTIELFEIPSTYTYDSVGTVTTGTQASTSVSATVTDASELLIGGVGVSASVAKTGINVQCNDVGDDGTTNPSSYFFTTVSGAVGQSPTCTVTTTASHATNGIMLSFESPVQPKFVPDGTPTTSSGGGPSFTLGLPSGGTIGSARHCFVAGCTSADSPNSLTISGGGDTWVQAPGSPFKWGADASGQTPCNLTNIVGATGTATVTPNSCTFACTGSSGGAYTVGNLVTIAGNTTSAFNGQFTITGCTANTTFTFASGTTGTGTGGTSGTSWEPMVLYDAVDTAGGAAPTVTAANGANCISAAFIPPTGSTCPWDSAGGGGMDNFGTPPAVIYAPAATTNAGDQAVWDFWIYTGVASATFSSPQPQNGNPLASITSNTLPGHLGTYPVTALGSTTMSQYGVVPSIGAGGAGAVAFLDAATPTPTATATATPTATATATATARHSHQHSDGDSYGYFDGTDGYGDGDCDGDSHSDEHGSYGDADRWGYAMSGESRQTPRGSQCLRRSMIMKAGMGGLSG